MTFHSTVLLFFGYLLVYAAVADHGRFASEPWAGLIADAYEAGAGSSSSSGSSSGPTVPSHRGSV